MSLFLLFDFLFCYLVTGLFMVSFWRSTWMGANALGNALFGEERCLAHNAAFTAVGFAVSSSLHLFQGLIRDCTEIRVLFPLHVAKQSIVFF